MRGVLIGEIASALAVVATLFDPQVSQYKWILIALIIGAGVGVPLGLVKMTAVPQRTAISHAFGALSAALIGIAEYYVAAPHVPKFEMAEIGARSDYRLAHIYREPDRRGQASGNSASAAHHVSRAELRQLVGAGRGACSDGDARRAPGTYASLSRSWSGVALVFGMMLVIADRRRGHAHGHLAVELLRRIFRGAPRLRAQQQSAGGGRRARRRFRFHSFREHVQGHEPLVHECAVRRLRPNPRQRRGRGGSSAR